MTDEDFLRYSRQIMLPEIGEAGQAKLADSKVLIVGLGGLGGLAAGLLGGAGVGELWLMDDDEVELSNLPRQLLFDLDSIGNAKVYETRNRLLEANPGLTVHALMERAGPEQLPDLVSGVDLVLDCSDNLATRFAINRACRARGRDLLVAAATGWQGQLMLFAANDAAAGCYQCLYPEALDSVGNCRTLGILGPVVASISTLQALEAIKHLAGVGASLKGKLACFDGKSFAWQQLQLNRDPQCPVCADASGNTSQGAKR